MDEKTKFVALAHWLIPRRRKVHIAIFLLTILMIPGALTALEPIDIESYELDSPEILAQQVIDDEFAATEHVMGFALAIRDPAFVKDDFIPVPLMEGGSPDVTKNPSVFEMAEFRGNSMGVKEPAGGILNLTVLREIDIKAETARAHTLGSYMKPMIE